MQKMLNVIQLCKIQVKYLIFSSNFYILLIKLHFNEIVEDIKVEWIVILFIFNLIIYVKLVHICIQYAQNMYIYLVQKEGKNLKLVLNHKYRRFLDFFIILTLLQNLDVSISSFCFLIYLLPLSCNLIRREIKIQPFSPPT